MKRIPLMILALLAMAVQDRVAAQGTYSTPYSFTTVAGLVTGGSADGPAAEARFRDPYGIAVDAAGNIYVSDAQNWSIRKISASGLVTTLAGGTPTSGFVEYTDAAGTAARFGSPHGLVADAAGNLFVADYSGHTIRKVTPAGVVSTFAGTPMGSGSVDGMSSAARFNRPTSVAMDRDGNLYVAEEGNHTIRKITPAAVVTTLAGQAGEPGSADGVGGMARFNAPKGVAVDAAGIVYVSDTSNHTVRRISPDGTVTTLAGQVGQPGSVDGTGAAAKIGYPQGLAVDAAGNIYVAEQGWYTIRRITPAGVVTTLAGLAATKGSLDGTGSAARFFSPRAVAVDAGGNVLVADTQNNRIRRVTPAGVVTAVAGPVGAAAGADGSGSAARFFSPWAIAVDAAGTVYVADTGNYTIRKISPGGAVTTLAGTAGVQSILAGDNKDGVGSAARFSQSLWGLAVDLAGNIYAADAGANTIRKISPAGVVTTLAGGNYQAVRGADGVGTAASFSGPRGLAVDQAGNVFVADQSNHTIRKITPAGVVTTLAGLAGVSGSTDGTGNAARFWSPSGLAVDGGGNVYVADSGNGIRRVTPAGVVTTVAGQSGVPGNTDGVGTAARFGSAEGIAIDAAGNLYVVDSANSVIRRITPGGVVSTLAGKSTVYNVFTRREAFGSTDGVGAAASFDRPRGIAADASGNVYVVDTYNEVIRYGVPATQRSPSFFTQPANGSVSAGGAISLSVAVSGHPAVSLRWQVSPDGVNFTDITDGGVYSGATTPNLTITGATAAMNNLRYRCVAVNGVPPNATSIAASLIVNVPPSIVAQPASRSASAGGSVNLAVAASSADAVAYQWYADGRAVTGATGSTLTLTSLQPANAGVYHAAITNAAGTIATDAAIVGVTSTSKITGAGEEVGSNIFVAANNNTFDQVLLNGVAATITADVPENQITRLSYIDLTDDIVQVEFSGAGTLTLVLDNPTGPAAPANYEQPTLYMKGHAGIVITGADETTNIGVFSVGRITAVNQGLFRSEVAYDGMADIAYIAIQSINGKFGGLRTANTRYFATRGLTGVYAPGVSFAGPVFVGDIDAFDTASPVLLIGSSPDTRITGGDLQQSNGQAVRVGGLARLSFTAGSTSHAANSLPARANRGVLRENGVDVTTTVVVNP